MAGSCFSVLDFLFFSCLWLAWLEYNTYAHQDECRRVKYLPPETGQYLEGHVFMNLTIGVYTPCEHRCVMERKCVSINIGPSIADEVICEMSDSDHLQHPEDLKIRPGWTYRSTENRCHSNPCLNNGTCVMGYTDKRYRCECSRGFTGENCEKDIDECNNDIHDCNENAFCTNTPGAFYCTCKKGYTGDGRSCSDCSRNLHYFKSYQDLPTRGASGVKQFSIDGSLFLAFANREADIESFNTDSFIYKLNDSTGNFTLHQTIDTTGARGLEHFAIANKHYLVVANRRNAITFKLNSTIYQWSGHQFVPFQNIRTLGATSFHFFEMFPHQFLAVTNSFDDTTTSINSVIYKWKDTHFETFQEIPTVGATSSATFGINNETFLAIANAASAVQSHLYKWSGESFVKLQSFQTTGDRNVGSFRINDDTFMVFINTSGGLMYKWIGTMFAPFQSFSVATSRSVHPFLMCGQQYLAVTGISQVVVYWFSGSEFIKYQDIPTENALDLTSFEHKGHTYLAVAKYRTIVEKRLNLNSKINIWI